MLKASRDRIAQEIESLSVSSRLLLVCNFLYEFSLGGGADRFGFDFQKRSLTWFDDGNVSLCVSTWPQCGRAIGGLLSLKELPKDESDKSLSLSQFRNIPVYISSFRVTQRDMFESVKRVTGTTDADWAITRESAEQRWKEGFEAVEQDNFRAFPKMVYSRMFLPSADGDYQSRRPLDNDISGLPVEVLDDATAVAVKMGENGEVAQSH